MKHMKTAPALVLALGFACTDGQGTPPAPEGDPATTTSEIRTPGCTCYWGYDECPLGWSCTDGWESFGCARRAEKGGSLAGGCTMRPEDSRTCRVDSDCDGSQRCINGYCNRQVAPCDARCAPSSNGSACGTEDRQNLAGVVGVWAEGIMSTALAGGGRLDPAIEERSRAYGLSETCELYVKRGTMWVAEMCTGSGLVQHPARSHEFEEHPIAALEQGTCRYDAANHCINALIDGLLDPTDDLELYREPPHTCGSRMPLSPDCGGAIDYMDCILERLRSKIESFTTPVQEDR